MTVSPRLAFKLLIVDAIDAVASLRSRSVKGDEQTWKARMICFVHRSSLSNRNLIIRMLLDLSLSCWKSPLAVASSKFQAKPHTPFSVRASTVRSLRTEPREGLSAESLSFWGEGKGWSFDDPGAVPYSDYHGILRPTTQPELFLLLKHFPA